MELRIDRTWDGTLVGDEEIVVVRLGRGGGGDLTIEVDAPLHGDPSPPGPPGPCAGLWEYEVVEVFLLGADERYTEVELGPWGHHLVLRLDGPRRIETQGLPLDYESLAEGRRWRGRAVVPRGYLPLGLSRGNAYAIHGVGPKRRYLAWHPVGGDAPDFHRLGSFPLLDLGST